MITHDFQLKLRVLTIISLLVSLSACVSNPLVEKGENSPNSLSNNAKNKVIAAELLKQDIEQLILNVNQIHPEAFSVFSEQQFNQAAERIKQSIYYPMTRNEFYLRIAPLVAKLKDVHSHVGIPKDDLKLAHLNKTSSARMLFPLAVLYESDGLYVAADLSNSPNVPTGAKVLAINDIPIDFILNKMAKLVAWETETGLRRKIQIEFPWLMATLGYAGKSYTIKYRWNQRTIDKNVSAIAPVIHMQPEIQEAADKNSGETIGAEQQAEDSKQFVESQSVDSFYGYSRINQQTVLLWFNDFYEKPARFETFLENQFSQLSQEGVENLIIDLRYNDGGRSQNLKNLLSYITHTPIHWSYKAEIKISEQLQNLHAATTEKRRKNKFSWGLQWLPLEWTDWLQYEISWSDAGEIVKVEFDPIQPAERPFVGRIKVLSNGFCFSACAAFIATVNTHRLAETIGETAGSVARVQYVYPIANLLKNSQLILTLPTVKVFHSDTETSRQLAIGVSRNLVRPQVEIQRSVKQIAARHDLLLNEALKRVGQH